MKRYIIAAALVLATVSCSKVYDATPVTQPAIGFSGWAEQLTKAARVPGTSTFTADGYTDNDFAVYGYKDKTSPAKATVFDDVVVSTTDGTTWNYTTPRYWDSTYDKYVFYAVSPASVGTGGTVDPQTGEITSAAITFAGNDNDILVADEATVNKTDGDPYFNGFQAVPIVFNHVASLVDFKVKKATGLHDATVTVSAFELSDIDNKGVLTVSTYTSTHPNATWSTDTKSTYGPANGVVPVSIASPIEIAEDTAFTPTTESTPAASTTLINNLVVKPQEFRPSNGSNPQKLTITYKIAVSGSADTQFTSVLYLANFDNIDNNAQTDTKIAQWEPGKHYIFYITIDANKISFSASITDWTTTVNGYHYLVN